MRQGQDHSQESTLVNGHMIRLPTHNVHLSDERVHLRPFTEADFDIVAHWFDDPEVMYYSEGQENPHYSRADIEGIYRETAQQGGLLFIIETPEGKVIGETWLQPVNLERLKKQPPDRAYRIDIMIGEKEYWGRRYGRHAVRLLLKHAFEVMRADRVVGISSEFNERSIRMFQACGLRFARRVPDQCTRAGTSYADVDLEITREDWLQSREALPLKW
jgi:RimJ/RimL family protein N-acetyltransferase